MLQTKNENSTVFIVDTYNPYLKHNENVCKKFLINERWWAIKEVSLDWGLPNLPIQLTDDAPNPQDFHLFDTYEDALKYMQLLKKVNN